MKTQVVIVGGGPGGAATALFLKQANIQSIVIEKDPFPRFHVGESMTGECGNIVRALGFTEEMEQRKHPIKEGVRVFGPGGKNAFWIPVMARDPEGKLVPGQTWQVRRSTFDKMLLDGVQDHKLAVIQGQAIKPLINADRSVAGVVVRSDDGQMIEMEADVLVDASGPATFLHKAGLTSEKKRGNYDNQVAIFSHVQGAIRDEVDNTLIFYRAKNHWGWFIPIDEEVVSIGVVVPAKYFAEQNESKHDFYLRELHELNTELTKRVENVTLTEEVRAISNYSYHIKEFTGANYLCIGDAHRFVDPIFSFGLFFAVSEAKLASEAIIKFIRGETAEEEKPFAEFQRLAERGQDTIQYLLDCFWEHPYSFAFFAHSRYPEDIIDIFAGRIYKEEPSPGLIAIRNRVDAGRIGHGLAIA